MWLFREGIVRPIMTTVSIAPRYHAQHKQQTHIEPCSSVLGHFPEVADKCEDRLTVIDVAWWKLVSFCYLERTVQLQAVLKSHVHQLLIVVSLQRNKEEAARRVVDNKI